MDVPAGWYPDPASPTSARWWDGTAWTDHTLPLDRIVPVAPPPSPDAPDSATLVLPVPSGDFVPPLVAPSDERPDYADTAVYPAGPAYAPYDSDTGPSGRRSPGWGAVALVGALALVLVLAGWLVYRGMTAGSDTGGSAASSAGPGASSPTPTSSGAAPATAAEAAAVLETFKPPASSLPQGIEATLIPQGDVAQGQKTLDGWCSDSYASEKNRIARRQWALTQNGQEVGLSIESVAYATSDEAAAALAEFTANTKACRNVRLTDQGTALVQNLVSSQAVSGLPEGISGYRGTITVDAAPTTGPTFTTNSTGTVQRKGQYLTIVWTNQSTPITAADRAVIDRFVAQQTAALSTTTS